MKLIIASNNVHKLEEIKAILGDSFEEILSLREAGIEHETVEDGASFAENAAKKARETAETINARVQKVTVRDTTSRWGSCSRTGHLSLSWRLALAPLFVADYVIAHEVAHLVQMNHSDAFWRVVETLSPDYEQAERWLKKNAAYLYSFSTGNV